MFQDDSQPPAEPLMVCPYCKGEFTNVPREVTIFDCGWCSNRLVVMEDAPAMYWKNFFSKSFSALFYLFMANPEKLMMRKIVSMADSWKENQKNLFVFFEMLVLATVYAFFSMYIKSTDSALLILTHPIFCVIPMGIGVYYFVAYTNKRLELTREGVPVIRPWFREKDEGE